MSEVVHTAEDVTQQPLLRLPARGRRLQATPFLGNLGLSRSLQEFEELFSKTGGVLTLPQGFPAATSV